MDTSILGRLRELAGGSPDKPAVTGDGQLSYAELSHGVEGLAAVLTEQSERRICVDYLRQAHSYLALLAGLAAGCEVTIARPDLVRSGNLPSWAGTPISTTVPNSRHAGIFDRSSPSVRIEPDTGALISLTTGSTGPPKGARISIGTVRQRNEAVVQGLGLTASDVVLAPLHLGSAYAQTVYVPAVLAGATVVIVPPEEDAMLEAARRHRATVLIATPTVWWNLVLDRRRAGVALHHLRIPAIGAEPVPMELARRVRSAAGTEPVLMYGTTETGLAMLGRMTDDGPLFRSVTGVRCVVERDGDGRGSLVVDGPLFDGYFDRAGQLRNRPSGAWHTGDLAEDTEDGVVILGRVDAMVKRGRRWIDPARIEADICRSSGVRQCSVTVIDDPRVGAVLVAVVSTLDRTTSAAQVMRALRTRRPRGELPDVITMCEELPQQAGKVDRVAVRRIAETARIPTQTEGGPAR